MKENEPVDNDGTLGKYIGPHQCFEVYLMTTSTFVWIGVGFLLWPFLANWLGQFEVLSFFSNIALGIPAYILGTLLIIAGLIIAHMEYAATSFVIRGSNLFIQYGIFNKFSNTIPLRYIIDCDIYEGPTEQALKVSTLIIRVLDGGRRINSIYLKFIKNSNAVRDFLLANSAAANSKIITSF